MCLYVKNSLGHRVMLCFSWAYKFRKKIIFFGIISNAIYNYISQHHNINNVVHFHTSIMMCIWWCIWILIPLQLLPALDSLSNLRGE